MGTEVLIAIPEKIFGLLKMLLTLPLLLNVAIVLRVTNCLADSCSIIAQAYSANTEACTTPTYGNITLNGVSVWRGSWCDSSVTNHRGVNTMIIDPFNCTYRDLQRFDTDDFASTVSALNLSTYLQQLPDGQILLAVSADDASRRLAPALPTLASLGVNVYDVQFRGSFVFIIQKGYREKTLVRKVLSNTEPYAFLSARLQGTTVEDVVITTDTEAATCTSSCPNQLNGNVLFSPSGVVTSPNYPSNYPTDINNLVYAIVADDKSTFTLKFNEFVLEYSILCQFDSIMIFADSLDYSEHMYEFCGRSAMNVSLSIDATRILLLFYSDQSVTARGFNLTYSVTAKTVSRSPTTMTTSPSEQTAETAAAAAATTTTTITTTITPSSSTAFTEASTQPTSPLGQLGQCWTAAGVSFTIGIVVATAVTVAVAVYQHKHSRSAIDPYCQAAMAHATGQDNNSVDINTEPQPYAGSQAGSLDDDQYTVIDEESLSRSIDSPDNISLDTGLADCDSPIMSPPLPCRIHHTVTLDSVTDSHANREREHLKAGNFAFPELQQRPNYQTAEIVLDDTHNTTTYVDRQSHKMRDLTDGIQSIHLDATGKLSTVRDAVGNATIRFPQHKTSDLPTTEQTQYPDCSCIDRDGYSRIHTSSECADDQQQRQQIRSFSPDVVEAENAINTPTYVDRRVHQRRQLHMKQEQASSEDTWL